MNNDILTRLMNGESADAIAKEFTDALNKAVKEKEAKDNQAEKVKDMGIIADKLNQYLQKYYGNCTKVSAENLVKSIEMSMNANPKVDKIIDEFLRSWGW